MFHEQREARGIWFGDLRQVKSGAKALENYPGQKCRFGSNQNRNSSSVTRVELWVTKVETEDETFQ